MTLARHLCAALGYQRSRLRVQTQREIERGGDRLPSVIIGSGADPSATDDDVIARKRTAIQCDQRIAIVADVM